MRKWEAGQLIPPQSNAPFCFCCRLFPLTEYNLIKGSVSDWKNAPSVLKTHESSPEHNKHLAALKELELHLKNGEDYKQAANVTTRGWEEALEGRS